MPASLDILYPDNERYVTATVEAPIRVSVGQDTLRYGVDKDNLSSSLAAGQSVIFDRAYWIKTDGDGAVVLEGFEPWDANLDDSSNSSTGDLRVLREAPLNVRYPEFSRLVTSSDDWTPAFDALMTKLDTAIAEDGGQAIAPRGDYSISDLIEVPANSELIGEGQRSTVFTATAAAAGIQIGDRDAGSRRGGESGHFRFDGNETSTVGVVFDGVSRKVVDVDVFFCDGDGFTMMGQNNTVYGVVSENHSGSAFVVDGSAGSNTVFGCSTSRCDRYGLEIKQSIDIEAGLGEPTYNTFISCIFERPGSALYGGSEGVALGQVAQTAGANNVLQRCVIAGQSSVAMPLADVQRPSASFFSQNLTFDSCVFESQLDVDVTAIQISNIISGSASVRLVGMNKFKCYTLFSSVAGGVIEVGPFQDEGATVYFTGTGTERDVLAYPPIRSPLPSRLITGDRTLTAADRGRTIFVSSGSSQTVTIPPNSDVNFPIGAKLFVSRRGAGSVTIAPGSGVTLNSPGGALEISPRYGFATLEKFDTDTWQVSGDLGANQTYAASNVTTDRTYDANATTTDELADVLGTLIADLRTKGIVT